LLELLQRIELGADGIGLADDFLRGLGVVPKFTLGHFGLEVGQLSFQRGQVKETSEAARGVFRGW